MSTTADRLTAGVLRTWMIAAEQFTTDERPLHSFIDATSKTAAKLSEHGAPQLKTQLQSEQNKQDLATLEAALSAARKTVGVSDKKAKLSDENSSAVDNALLSQGTDAPHFIALQRLSTEILLPGCIVASRPCGSRESILDSSAPWNSLTSPEIVALTEFRRHGAHKPISRKITQLCNAPAAQPTPGA